MNKQKKFWNWRNQADGADPGEPRVLELYGTIASESWFDDDVTPQMFRDELFADDGDVVIYLNSPGGDCIAASQIYTMLMDYKGNVTVKIDGIAASAASVIAMAGTSVLMAPTNCGGQIRKSQIRMDGLLHLLGHGGNRRHVRQ